LTPLRDCCKQCHQAAAYGALNPNYQERWSKAALAKRERDEQVKYERGECAVKTFFSKMCPEENKKGNLTPVPEAVDELEFAQKRMSLDHLNPEVVEQSDEADSDGKEVSDAQTVSSASTGSSASHMSSRTSISTAATTPPSFEGGAPLGRPCSKPTRSACINPNLDNGGAMHKEILAALQDADVHLAAKKGSSCAKREEGGKKQQQKGWARFTSFGKGLSMMPAMH
jgi:hypothetical protein